MKTVGELIQTADWKSEKHVPVIECENAVKAGEVFPVKVVIGKEVAHPNVTEHHIRWISLYFLPNGSKFPYQIGNFEFTAHGESIEGANQGAVYTNHEITASLKLLQGGAIYALSLCNIHGLWQSMKEIEVSS